MHGRDKKFVAFQFQYPAQWTKRDCNGLPDERKCEGCGHKVIQRDGHRIIEYFRDLASERRNGRHRFHGND